MLFSVSEKLYEKTEEKDLCIKISGLYVMAPVMCLYVAWVIREAYTTGKKRLYFLSRDGYSMYEVAQILCKKLEIPIECRYLYCSRYAWRSAEYYLMGEEGVDAVCLGGIDVTFGKIMARAGLSEREGREIALLLRREEKYEDVLSHGQREELRSLLAECSPFTERMTKRSESRYPYVCGYLKQEGLLDGVSWALVDSGWTGNMQKSLQHLLGTMGYQGKVEGYYFGMFEYPRGVDRSAYHSWYFHPFGGLRRKVFFSNSLFECIFSSPEGMAVGYVQEGDVFGPVLEKTWNPNREKIRKSTLYLKQYAETLAEEYGREFLFCDSKERERKLVFSLFQSFMGKPVKAEAETFGSYIFCDDVIGEANQKVAAGLTPGQIRENRLLYKAVNRIWGKRILRESAWMEGSILLSGMSDGELRHCRICKYARYMIKSIHNITCGLRKSHGGYGI